MEIWKKIKEFNSDYEISNNGRVRSCHGVIIKSDGNYYTRKSKILKPSKSNNDYYRGAVCVNKKIKPYKVHRLVALYFVKNPLNKEEVNHIDGNKYNNYYKNLEWCTRQENIQHCVDNKLQIPFKGEEVGNSKLKEWQVLEIRAKYIPRVYGRNILGREYNVSPGTIKQIVKRKTWKHLP